MRSGRLKQTPKGVKSRWKSGMKPKPEMADYSILFRNPVTGIVEWNNVKAQRVDTFIPLLKAKGVKYSLIPVTGKKIPVREIPMTETLRQRLSPSPEELNLRRIKNHSL